MEYINKCITPRMKRCDSDNSVKSNSSSDSDGYGGAGYFRHALSTENLQQLRDDYYKKQMSSPRPLPTPRTLDRSDFLCTFCLSSCYHTTRDTVLTDGGLEQKWDQTTFSSKNRQKYKDDGSFLKFHLRVLFCLD